MRRPAARGRVNAGAIRRIPNSRRLPQWKAGSIHLIQDSIRINISLETLMILVYLAKLPGEDRGQSDCYLTLAEEKILELLS
jgi:hypothetical protein